MGLLLYLLVLRSQHTEMEQITRVIRAKHPLEVGERKDGVWRRTESSYWVVLKINGKLHKKSFGSDHEAAFLYAARIKQESKIEKMTGNGNPILDQILQKKIPSKKCSELFVDYLKAREPFLREGTIYWYIAILKRLKPIGDIYAGALTYSDVSEYVVWLKTGDADNLPLSNKMVKEILSFCKSAFNHALKSGLFQGKNVFEEYKSPKVEQHDPQPFTSEEVSKIFEQLNPRLCLLFQTQLVTGMRSGEVLGLQFGDLNFEANQIHIKRTRSRGKDGPPKTASSVRTIHMPESIRDDLAKERKRRDASEKDYVFVTQYGLPYTETPNEAWVDALERAGVPRRQPYTLRHTFASHALRSGMNLSYVSRALGHTNVQVTASKYIKYVVGMDTVEEEKLTSFTNGLVTKRDTI